MRARQIVAAAATTWLVAAAGACSIFGASDTDSPGPVGAEGGPSGGDGGGDGGDGGDGGGAFASPATTVAQAKQAVSIATDEKTIYWVDKVAGTTVSVPKSGGEPVTLATTGNQPDYLFASVDKLYWLTTLSGCGVGHDHLFELTKGTTVAPSVIWPTESACYGTYRMAVAVGYFYVQQENGIVEVDPTTHVRTPLAGNENVISGLAGDGNAVFWTGATEVRMVKQPNAGASTFAAAVGATELAVDPTTVYWLQGDGSIQKLERSKPQTMPTKLVGGETGAQRLALGPDDVYWTNRDTGSVKSIPKAGGAVRTLAQGESGAFAIAVDADGVYWSNLGDGKIRTIRR